MAKTTTKTTLEIMDQVAKARQALDYFDQRALDDRGVLRSAMEVRSHLNAARAHITRASEKADALK
ncbi:MAG: hypothetical protein HQL64_05760 [Magnetococcales bacterium]|nr:hypothetical protein [Magnetococcales bacterium]